MADLAQIARDVARAPETAVRATARDVAAAADRVGGVMRWHGRVVSLGADVRSRTAGSSATVTSTVGSATGRAGRPKMASNSAS